MLSARLIAIRWLLSNIGLLKTIRIFLEMFVKVRKEHLISFVFQGKRIKMAIQSERTDLAMITEIFCFESYEIRKKIRPRLIVDGGANKGSAAVYFGIKYPDAKIHCYEPNVDLAPVLRKNLELNGINAEIFNEALSDKEGILFFEKSVNHQFSRLTESDSGLRVRAVALGERYAGQRIDILKLDVEGEEEKIINSLDLKELNVDIIIQEIHHDRVDGKAIADKLISGGYEIEPPYEQYRHLNSEEEYPILLAIKSSLLKNV